MKAQKQGNSEFESFSHAISDSAHLHLLMPEAAVSLIKLASDESNDIRELSVIIESEPGLSMQVLKTINSPYFNPSRPVHTISKAIGSFGFSTVLKTALKLLMYNKMIARPTGQSFDLLFFWQHSLFVAALSRELAISLKYPDPEIIYIAGLLHDIGKLVLESYGNLSYSDFIAANTGITTSILKNELIYFGVNHEQVGYLFCRKSQLPDIVTSVAANHTNDSFETSHLTGFNKENAIVTMANYLAGIHHLGSFAQEPSSVLSHSVVDMIEINSLNMQAILDTVDQEMCETSSFYGIRYPGLSELRANLINTMFRSTIHLPSDDNSMNAIGVKQPSAFNSLTIPHQSLDPETFVPQTLRAIQETFNFDRVFMLSMSNRTRSLTSKHCWPQQQECQTLEINVDTLTGDLLSCLRTRHAAVITKKHFKNRSLLNHIGVNEFIAIPVLRNKRLCAVLYADNKYSQEPVKQELLPQIAPIAKELGSALYNARCFELEKNRAEIDPLTSLSNKRMIMDFLEKLYSDDQLDRNRIGLGFLDIDHFKKLNDECGHQAGDEALKVVADILRSLTRDGDFTGRYGGEEFVFILPDCTLDEAKKYAERIRAQVEKSGRQLKQKFNNNALSASIGIAMYQEEFQNYSDLISAADKAMYEAKHSGRNKVISFDSISQTQNKVVSINRS